MNNIKLVCISRKKRKISPKSIVYTLTSSVSLNGISIEPELIFGKLFRFWHFCSQIPFKIGNHSIRQALLLFFSFYVHFKPKCFEHEHIHTRERKKFVYDVLCMQCDRQIICPITHNISFCRLFSPYYYYLCEYVTSTEMRFIIPQQWTLQYLHFVGKMSKSIVLNVLFYASCIRKALTPASGGGLNYIALTHHQVSAAHGNTMICKLNVL